MSSIDQQFVEFVVKSLVSQPDKIKVERRIDEKGVLLELTVDPEDLGRVIGKHGATAQSIRTLLRALGTKNDARYNLKIVDNGVPRHEDGGSKKPDYESKTTQSVEELSDVEMEPINEPVKSTVEKDDSPDRFKQTRDELAEFDDLDV